MLGLGRHFAASASEISTGLFGESGGESLQQIVTCSAMSIFHQLVYTPPASTPVQFSTETYV
jgi:hypothetical protein